MIGLILSILFLTSGGERTSNLDSYLRENLSNFKKYEYEIVSLPAYVNSIDDERISYKTKREFKINYGYAYVPVDVILSDKNISQSVITVKMNLFADVLVANRKIKRGEVVSAGDFTVKEEEVTHLRSGAVKEYSKIINSQTTMNIAEGAILQENMIETVPVFKAGEKVTAFSEVGTVIVSFQVTLREDGRIGDEIRVVRDDKLTFKALVVDSEKVKIIE